MSNAQSLLSSPPVKGIAIDDVGLGQDNSVGSIVKSDDGNRENTR